MQVIAPEKPLKGAVGFEIPVVLPGDMVCLQAGRNHGLGFDRLLIKASALTVLWLSNIKSDL
jgi:hypothetical protein